MNKKKTAIIVAVAAVVGAGAWYASSQSGQTAPGAGAKGAAGAQAPTVVNVVAPLRQDVPVVLQASGTVMPISSVDLRAQTTSIIRQVHIKEGQFVRAGQLMFSLDDRSERANVDKAQAQIVRDQAALSDVERQVRRGQELYAQKFIAQGALETLTSQLESARAVLGADRAALESTRVSVSYNAIRAPMAGRVGAIGVYAGSLVQPSTSLTSITQLDPINVGFSVPEAALSDLLAAQKRGAVAVEARVGGGRPIDGALSFVDNAVDPVAGSIRVKARFDNRDTALWPGQYVNTHVTLQTLAGVIVIPQTAIISNTRGTFVYVVEPDQSARQVPVVRLHSFGLNAAVSGLTGSEQVITEGKQNLRPGSKVKLAEAPGASKRDGARPAKKGAAA
jgi:multidrug efflux system membrane fusion protein